MLVKVQSTGMNLQVYTNEKCNFEYYHELTPEYQSTSMKVIISYLQDYQCLGLFSVPKIDKFQILQKVVLIIIIKKTQLCLSLVHAGPYYLQENVLSCEDENVYLHMYHTVNMAVVNYFGTQIPKNREHLCPYANWHQQNCMEKIWLNQKTISQFQMYYYLKTQWILTLKDLQVRIIWGWKSTNWTCSSKYNST